jgi:hypothetical protein
MGQYGNQPDFGTIVATLDGMGGVNETFPPSAIYVGQTVDMERCNIEVLPVGNDPMDTISITAIQPGTFLPIVVTKITDLEGVLDKDILLYR